MKSKAAGGITRNNGSKANIENGSGSVDDSQLTKNQDVANIEKVQSETQRLV